MKSKERGITRKRKPRRSNGRGRQGTSESKKEVELDKAQQRESETYKEIHKGAERETDRLPERQRDNRVTSS